MADYICSSRTNYFRVTDEKLWREWLDDVCDVEDFSTTTEDGTALHAFGCYGTPWYDHAADDDADDYYSDGSIFEDHSLERIQAFLPEGEAMIYMEAGWEKLRYVTGSAVIVTRDGIRSFDTTGMAIDIAREMLGDGEWTSITDY